MSLIQLLTGKSVLLLVAMTLLQPMDIVAQDKDRKVSVGATAGIGALLGLGLGRSLGDVIGGAAVGAAGGLIANEVIKQKDASDQRKARAQERDRAQAQSQAESQPSQPQSGTNEELTYEELEAQFEEAIGRDNYESYNALRACEYERASGLAKVGALSKNEEHRLTSLWLEAMIAVDSRDSEKARKHFEEIVQRDPDIDTLQQANLETDKAVLDLRAERRELDMPSCR